MENITVQGNKFKPYISHEDLMASIDQICRKLDADYADCETPPILLCTLHGAILFTSEIMQRIHFETELSCIQISSYDGLASSGMIKSVVGPTASVKGKKVIVLEDIVDTGLTIVAMRKLLKKLGAEEVKVCTLLYKDKKFAQQMKEHGLDIEENEPEYYGISIPDYFILGFGMDYYQHGRNHKDIYILEQ